jgi:hypothetical protein
MQKLPVMFLKCGFGGIRLCGAIALFFLRYSDNFVDFDD